MDDIFCVTLHCESLSRACWTINKNGAILTIQKGVAQICAVHFLEYFLLSRNLVKNFLKWVNLAIFLPYWSSKTLAHHNLSLWSIDNRFIYNFNADRVAHFIRNERSHSSDHIYWHIISRMGACLHQFRILLSKLLRLQFWDVIGAFYLLGKVHAYRLWLDKVRIVYPIIDWVNFSVLDLECIHWLALIITSGSLWVDWHDFDGIWSFTVAHWGGFFSACRAIFLAGIVWSLAIVLVDFDHNARFLLVSSTWSSPLCTHCNFRSFTNHDRAAWVLNCVLYCTDETWFLIARLLSLCCSSFQLLSLFTSIIYLHLIIEQINFSFNYIMQNQIILVCVTYIYFLHIYWGYSNQIY